MLVCLTMVPNAHLVHYQTAVFQHYDVFQLGLHAPRLTQSAQQKVKKAVDGSWLVSFLQEHGPCIEAHTEDIFRGLALEVLAESMPPCLCDADGHCSTCTRRRSLAASADVSSSADTSSTS